MQGKEKEAHHLRRRGKGRERTVKMPYNMGEDVCRVSSRQADRAKHFGNRIKELKTLDSMQKCGDKHLEDPRNFPDAKRVLTVNRIGSGAQKHQNWHGH